MQTKSKAPLCPNEERYQRLLRNFFKRPQNRREVIAGWIKSVGKPKVFCIGKNKTGTTSMKRAFVELGYVAGNQRLAELLVYDWAKRDFSRLFRYCLTAQAFQDFPFSYPFTFQALDQHFHGSKFILTVRDSAEQWYESLVSFHSKIWGHGKVPTIEDLKEARYVFKGYAYEVYYLNSQTPPDDPYNREILIAGYRAYNHAVKDYFRHRPDDLLVLNVAEPGAYDRLCDFLGKPRMGKDFPHENKTEDVKPRK
jgi:hypothetical protein